MSHPRLGEQDIAKRGQELYEQSIRQKRETPENIGKIVSIDVESGDYEIDDDLVKAAKRLKARRPEAKLWGERIGYDAVYAVGGSLTRTSQ